jgi:hypothetical protein
MALLAAAAGRTNYIPFQYPGVGPANSVPLAPVNNLVDFAYLSRSIFCGFFDKALSLGNGI